MHLARSRSLMHSPITRRRLVGGALGAAAVLALPRAPSPLASAQSMDPFTYIVTMPATTDLGQRVGQPAAEVGPVNADGSVWDAYIQLPIKEGQDFHYTCEFDSAWILL